MKKMFEKKLALLLAALLLAVGGAFISCSSDDDGGENKKEEQQIPDNSSGNNGDSSNTGDSGNNDGGNDNDNTTGNDDEDVTVGVDGIFIKGTYNAVWSNTPTFYLIQQIGSITVTDSTGADTARNYTANADEWWTDNRVNTSSIELENGESITWNVTVTSDTFGLVLEGVDDGKFCDLNLSYAKSDDAWGAGTWNIESHNSTAYGIKGHIYEITVAADQNGSLYTVTVADVTNSSN